MDDASRDEVPPLGRVLARALSAITADGERVGWLTSRHRGRFSVRRAGADGFDGAAPGLDGPRDDVFVVATDGRFVARVGSAEHTIELIGGALLRALEAACPRLPGRLVSLELGVDLAELARSPHDEAARVFDRSLGEQALLVRARALAELAEAGHRWAAERAIAWLSNESVDGVSWPARFDLARAALSAGSEAGVRAIRGLLSEGAFHARDEGSPRVSLRAPWPEHGTLPHGALREALARAPAGVAREVRRLSDRHYAPRVGVPLFDVEGFAQGSSRPHDASPLGALPAPGSIDDPTICVRLSSRLMRRSWAGFVWRVSRASVTEVDAVAFLRDHLAADHSTWARCDARCPACERPWPDAEALWRELAPPGEIPRIFHRGTWGPDRGLAHPPWADRPPGPLEVLGVCLDPLAVVRAEAAMRTLVERLRGWGLAPFEPARWTFRPGDPAFDGLAALWEQLSGALTCCECAELTAGVFVRPDTPARDDLAERARLWRRWRIAWKQHPSTRPLDLDGRELLDPFEPLSQVIELGFDVHRVGRHLALQIAPP